MRALVPLCLLAMTASARSEVMVEEPSPSSVCRSSKTWPSLLACLDRFSPTELVETSLSDVQVVRLSPASPDYGFLLYVRTASGWQIGGRHYGPGELESIERITIGKHTGYRMRIAYHAQSMVQLGEAMAVGAVSTRSEAYCAGTGVLCTEVIVACDVFVHGRAVRTFRGTVTATPTKLVIDGDRTFAGHCSVPTEMALRWQ